MFRLFFGSVLPSLSVVVVLGFGWVGRARDAAPPPAASPAELVRQLGSDDYAEREEAMRRLDDLGPAALDALRAGVRSDNPEIAWRSLELLRRIGRRSDNERTLTPTLVELDVRDEPLDAVLARLSRQAQWEVVLGGPRPEELANRRVTLTTGGRVPFWEAVRQVCGVADLQIAVANGFLAPGAGAYSGRPRPGVRTSSPHVALVLEPRGEAARRPAAVRGAVLVEAVPLPPDAVAGGAAAVLQVWPEPRLRWEETTGMRVLLAQDPTGSRLTADFTPLGATADRPPASDGVVLVRHPDGTAGLARAAGTLPSGLFRPHARQAVVRFRGDGPSPPTTLETLDVVLTGKVRSGTEPVCRVTTLEPNREAVATGPGGTELRFRYTPRTDGPWTARAEIRYRAGEFQPVAVTEPLPGVRLGPGFVSGNSTLSGLLLTDADGRPFALGLVSGHSRSDPGGGDLNLSLELTFDPGRRVPAAVSLWGSYRKAVDVAVSLRGVGLTGSR